MRRRAFITLLGGAQQGGRMRDDAKLDARILAFKQELEKLGDDP